MSIGQVFLGKYRVDAILGHGGMGVVAKCTHLQLGEAVAIKMLRKDVLLDRDAVERFTREAQAAAKLRSEYVARVSDVGTFEGGVPYMVMEFLDGHDLGELLDTRGALPVPWACELMLQTAEALAEAHSIGVVHRDVKPTNLFVTWRPDGSALIKVLDFGISKAPVGTDMQLTQTQSLLGTPAYMSPEQMRSARLVDARTDIWSLGTVFYELLEGRRPFEAESFSEMCVKVAVDPPEPMRNTPPALQQVVLRCLAKSPEQRYANMAELARDLIPFVQDPHQATVLVERMQRVVRRGAAAADWDKVPGTSAGVSRASSPVIASDPRLRTPAAGVPIMDQPQAELSRPVASRAPSAVVELPEQPAGKRSKLPLIVLALCVLVGIGIGMVVALGGDDPPAAREQAKEPSREPSKANEHHEVGASQKLPPGSAATVKKDEKLGEEKVGDQKDEKLGEKKDEKTDEPRMISEGTHEAAPEIQMPDSAVRAVPPPPVVKKDPPPVVRKDPPVVRHNPPVVKKDPPVVKKDPPTVKKDPVVEPPKPPDPPKRDPFAAPRPTDPPKR